MPGKLLLRLDSGNDDRDNIRQCLSEGVDFLIKRNHRRETAISWLETAQLETEGYAEPREGKQVYTGSEIRDIGDGIFVRVVFQVTVRTIDKKGQILLTPEIDSQSWWTNLKLTEEEVIQLYREHATCEQFHSEIKSDIGLERFPSGYLDTNGAILKLAMLAYNILRIIGQTALAQGQDTKKAFNVARLRAKTVIQRFMYIASHVTKHARRHFQP